MPPLVYVSDIQLPRDPTAALHATTKQYVDTGLSSKAASSHTHTTSQITGLGTAATCNTGTASGNVPVIGSDGKLNAAILPFTAGSFIPLSDKAVANGVATLDASVKIPIAQIPTQATVSNSTALVPTGAAVYAHTNATSGANAHNATATPTASRIAMWDANKRLKSDTPSAADDVANKSYVDSLSSGYRTTITGNGTLTEIPVTHDLNSTEVEIRVFKSGTPPTRVEIAHNVVSANQITLSFAVAPPSTDSYIVRVKV
jgi:hypothetical protein